MSHTPGPWRCYIDDDGGGTFAVAIEKHDGSWPLRLSVENAALIAAAPDLLAALKGLRALIIGECGTTMYECIDGERADDAIAKAEGR